MAAIGHVESSGNYRAVGPTTRDGNRAYGKYQVMDFNIGPWTRQALGRTLTPAAFLADSAAQDTTVRVELQRLLARWGNAADVAAVWFSGRPLQQSANDRDITGTTVTEYVGRVLEAMT